ncbi:MAG: phosphotransferase [Firmicutes bacterium]|nr:phosphotransferase [Bacillota bacterium]
MVSKRLLARAAESYGFKKRTLHFISESTNQIYRFQKDGKCYILRFSRRPHEQALQTKAEMDWLCYLASHGMGVSLPLPAGSGELVLSAEDGGKPYVISAFEALPGRNWDKNNPELWNADVFYLWGRAMGDMHRLTKDYSPSGGARGSFTGRDTVRNSFEACPAVHKTLEKLQCEIMALPKDRDSYGLIHYDLHPWNFLIDGGRINVFDFDDSLYGWFPLDIGVALYHGLWWGRKNDAGQAFAEEIVRHFLRGYLSANQLSDFWISKIPLFLRYRQICKFSWFYDPAHADGHQEERIRNIENGMLFSDLSLRAVELMLER